LKNIPQDKDYEYFYRGHSNVDFKIIPSIYRQQFIVNEDKFFKEIILKNPNEFINEKTTLEKLVKMQHYGLPTRILDITINPLVALYFAVKELPEKNGEVIIFKIPKTCIKFYDSDTVSILSNISKRPFEFEINSLKNMIKKYCEQNFDSEELGYEYFHDFRYNKRKQIDFFNEQEQIAYLLHEIREEKPYFLSIIQSKDIERVLAVKVKMSNNRIIKQNGSFLIFGINGSKGNPANIPPKWILKGIDFEIDAGSKDNIANDLDTLGFNESTLFPELENQATYLKQLYK
jgi:hypothetical protein